MSNGVHVRLMRRGNRFIVQDGGRLRMKNWIKEIDHVRFCGELEAFGVPLEIVPERAYLEFTGVNDRHFFDYVLDAVIREGIPGSGKTGTNIFVAKEELASFNDRLRLLNSTLFTYRYVGDTANLVRVEFAIQIRKTRSPVSAVIPTFNPHIPLLKRCIASVLHAIDSTSAADASEVLVVDDASPNSAEITALLRDDYSGDPRIKYFRLPQNSGVSTARNTGVTRAVNDIVFLVDHDDTVEPLHVNLGAQEIDRGGIDLVATNMRFPDRHIFSAHLSPRHGMLIENGFGSGIVLNKASPRIKALMGSGELYNTLNKSHFEDWELNAVAKLLGWRIVIAPYASYFYEYAETGRDSTNLSLKARAALLTPLHAIQRVRPLSPEQAYAYLGEYCEVLIDRIMDTDIRMIHLDAEMRRARTAEANATASAAHAAAAQQQLQQSMHQLQAALEQELARKRNIIASLKGIVSEVEARLASRRAAFFLYRFAVRPLVYFPYVAVRFVYRLVGGGGGRRAPAL